MLKVSLIELDVETENRLVDVLCRDKETTQSNEKQEINNEDNSESGYK